MTVPTTAILSREPAETTSHVVRALLPLMVVVLAFFLISGLALPVLPLYVHRGLSLGSIGAASSPEASSWRRSSRASGRPQSSRQTAIGSA